MNGTVVATDVDGPTPMTYALGQHRHCEWNCHDRIPTAPTPTRGPRNFNGGDSFHLHGERQTGHRLRRATGDQFTLTVTAVNDAPVAQDGSASGNEERRSAARGRDRRRGPTLTYASAARRATAPSWSTPTAPTATRRTELQRQRQLHLHGERRHRRLRHRDRHPDRRRR